MLCRSGLALAILLMASASALAQAPRSQPPPFPGYQGTAREQDACEPAVLKFCRAVMPDQFRILQCLQANRPRIGKACQAVLAAHGV